MIIDYKFKNIRRDGKKTKFTINACEGEFRDMQVYDPITMSNFTIYGYCRDKVLWSKDMEILGDVSDENLRGVCNLEIEKDTVREKLDVQVNSKAVTDSVKTLSVVTLATK